MIETQAVVQAQPALPNGSALEEPVGSVNDRHFSLACHTAIAIGASAIAIALVTGFYVVGCLAATILCGISEAIGRCGMSHIGMIAPFRTVAPGLWLRCSLAYSAGGIATSYFVGLALACLGTLLEVQTSMLFFAGSGAVAVLMLLRETGIIGFNPPHCDRQTEKSWVFEFGHVTAAGMWGSHIGLGVTTVVKHGGLYPVVLLAVGFGLGQGEWVLVCFWCGRIIPMWLAPRLAGGSSDGSTIAAALRRSERSFRAVAAWGIAGLAAVCIVATFEFAVV